MTPPITHQPDTDGRLCACVAVRRDTQHLFTCVFISRKRMLPKSALFCNSAVIFNFSDALIPNQISHFLLQFSFNFFLFYFDETMSGLDDKRSTACSLDLQDVVCCLPGYPSPFRFHLIGLCSFLKMELKAVSNLIKQHFSSADLKFSSLFDKLYAS